MGRYMIVLQRPSSQRICAFRTFMQSSFLNIGFASLRYKVRTRTAEALEEAIFPRVTG